MYLANFGKIKPDGCHCRYPHYLGEQDNDVHTDNSSLDCATESLPPIQAATQTFMENMPPNATAHASATIPTVIVPCDREGVTWRAKPWHANQTPYLCRTVRGGRISQVQLITCEHVTDNRVLTPCIKSYQTLPYPRHTNNRGVRFDDACRSKGNVKRSLKRAANAMPT